MRGFAGSFGIAGGVVSVAQDPAYAEQYGMKCGAWEIFKDVFDPLGFSEGQTRISAMKEAVSVNRESTARDRGRAARPGSLPSSPAPVLAAG